MSYKPTRRHWIKLWVEEHLSGTTRFELKPDERAVWVDLLALGGRSKYPGVIAAGEYQEGYRGYPLLWLAGTLNYEPGVILATLQKCQDNGKIQVEKTEFEGVEHYVIHIVNWPKYQSEYQRQRKYRQKMGEKVTTQNTQRLLVEEEEEKEKEGEGDHSVTTTTQILDFYDKNIERLTPELAKRLRDAVGKYHTQWLWDALHETIAAGEKAKNWRYFSAILRSWVKKGRKWPREKGAMIEQHRNHGEPK